MPNIVFFGSGNIKEDNKYFKLAQRLAEKFSEDGHDILSGGYGGIMEAAHKGGIEYNNEKVGITTFFYEKEANKNVTLEIKEKNYTDRLLKLIALGDAFVIFPGGSGTLLELSSLWAYIERGIKEASPIVVIGEQWYEMIQTLGFYSEEILSRSSIFEFTEDIDEAHKYISSKLKQS